MTFVFHILLCILFVVLQTVVFPIYPFLSSFFDLFIPVIVNLGLFRPLRESIPAVILFGTVMDSLSGAPFGVYLSCYVWLFVAVYWFKGFLHIHSYTLLSLIVFLGVLLENIIFLMVVNVGTDQWYIFSNATGVLFMKLSTAAIFGPFVIIYVKRMYDKTSQTIGKFREEL